MKTSRKIYLALDIGASIGKAVLGFLEKGILEIEEVHRFSNVPVRMNGTLYWNTLSLWTGVVESLRIAANKGYTRLDGIGVDTWGSDFALLGADGKMLGEMVHYRDSRTEGIENDLLQGMNPQTVFHITGYPVYPILALGQLLALRKMQGEKTLKAAQTLLMAPDVFRYFLCGKVACDWTIAAVTQMFDYRKGEWSAEITKAFNIPRRVLPPLVKPGTVAGELSPEVSEETGIKSASLIAVAGHDTPSAVAAVPCVDFDTAFISSGSWVVVGVVNEAPIENKDKDAIELGFMNEPGFESILFAKDMMGLYLFELLHRTLNSGGETVSYASMVREASEAKPFSCFLNPNAPLFFSTADVGGAAKSFLKETGQRTVSGQGAIMRAILEGIAFSCRQAIDHLERLTNRKLATISMVGGGIRNHVLCQFIANATGREVIAGPAEATVIGNLGIQAYATGQLRNALDIRDMISSSFKLAHYKPKDTPAWDRNFTKFTKIVAKST